MYKQKECDSVFVIDKDGKASVYYPKEIEDGDLDISKKHHLNAFIVKAIQLLLGGNVEMSEQFSDLITFTINEYSNFKKDFKIH